MSGVSTYVDKGMIVFKLLFPSVILRWIVAVMVAIFLIACALTELLKMDGIGIVAGVAGIHLMFIGMLAIPSQMVAFASSRTSSFLVGSRGTLLAIYVLLSVLLSLAICWLWDLAQLNHYSPLMFLAVWLTTSLIFQASVYLSTRWPVVHFSLFSIYLMLDDIVSWLESYDLFYIAVFILVSWVLYAKWWFVWKPTKYKVNLFFVGMAAEQKMILDQRSTSWFYSGPAKSWLGSRLSGVQDGWVFRSKCLLPNIVITPLCFIPGYFIMGEVWLKAFVHLFFIGTSVVIAQVVQSTYAVNLRRVWLYSGGNRSEIYSLLLKRFWLDVAPLTLLIISIPFGLNLFWGIWYGAEVWIYSLLSLFLLQLLVFHLFWWVYQRTQASLLWSHLVCGGLVIWWFLMSIATGFLMKFPVDWQDLSPLWIIIPELVLLALLYRPVRYGFAGVNFARVL